MITRKSIYVISNISFWKINNIKKSEMSTSHGSITATFPAGKMELNFAAVEHPPDPPPTTTNL